MSVGLNLLTLKGTSNLLTLEGTWFDGIQIQKIMDMTF